MYTIYNVSDIISKNLLWSVTKFLKSIGLSAVGRALLMFEPVRNCKSEKCLHLRETSVNYDKFIIRSPVVSLTQFINIRFLVERVS